MAGLPKEYFPSKGLLSPSFRVFLLYFQILDFILIANQGVEHHFQDPPCPSRDLRHTPAIGPSSPSLASTSGFHFIVPPDLPGLLKTTASQSQGSQLFMSVSGDAVRL
jgi:hypothetical protein